MKLSAIWLAPLAFLYGIATRFRNYLYNIGYSKSFNYEIMVIAVGNLSVGGTGKSPMTEYFIRLLHSKYSLSTLSRGYKRKTKGFLIADEYTAIDEIGDEPYQMYLKYNKVTKVAVGEERSIAIPNILLEHPETQVVIMDDGYQHRSVRPDFSLLLTDYNHLFYNDHLLPWGRLREAKVGARRASAIIVTKCPNQLDANDINQISDNIRRYAGKEMPIFFSKIIYSRVLSLTGKPNSLNQRFIAFAGLANSDQFLEYISTKFELVGSESFADHHNYSVEDVKLLVDKAKENDAVLITTEKDIVKFRNKSLLIELGDMPLYYLSIEHKFIKDGNVFDTMVMESIEEKYKVEE